MKKKNLYTHIHKTDTWTLQKTELELILKCYLPYVTMTFPPTFKGF